MRPQPPLHLRQAGIRKSRMSGGIRIAGVNTTNSVNTTNNIPTLHLHQAGIRKVRSSVGIKHQPPELAGTFVKTGIARKVMDAHTLTFGMMQVLVTMLMFAMQNRASRHPGSRNASDLRGRELSLACRLQLAAYSAESCCLNSSIAWPRTRKY